MSFLTRASPPSIFPIYLLPSLPFRRRKTSSDSTISTSSSRSPDDATGPFLDDKYINHHSSYLRCVRCAADLCLTSQIISKGFTGRHGRAYLVSGPGPSSTTNDTTPSLPNTNVHKAVPRQLVTGQHHVSDISCKFCGTMLGWKYVAAEEEAQRYKVGKYILETKKICSVTCWENEEVEEEVMDEGGGETVMDAPPLKLESSQPHEEEVEFDSQDEDECEDLFTGVWSPSLAVRRRQGRRFVRDTGR